MVGSPAHTLGPLAHTHARFQQHHRGQIDASEFGRLLYDFGVILTPDQEKAALQKIDNDNSGMISYDEFTKWWRQGEGRFSKIRLTDAELKRRQQAAAIFAHFDKDRSGTIDRAEFGGLYRMLAHHNLTKRSEEMCLRELDANGDGSLQLNEFVEWLETGEH